MRLAEDRRARVPFAVVGVLLLVGSVTFATTLAARRPVDVDSAPGQAKREVTAAARSALLAAAQRASRAAARTPLVDPANTSWGAVVNDSTPFRDALRIRTYLQARRALARVNATVGDATATVSLPPITDPASLRAAKRRVRVRELESGVRLTVRNVTVTVERRGRVVERSTYAPSVVVRTPALALHRNVTRFQRRLNASMTEPGLGRRLTATLYALAWVRGYAQYGGAPVVNVLATRHVELATNAALLDVQRAAFGLSDPRGDAALRRAALHVGATDLLAGSLEGWGSWSDTVLTPDGPTGTATPSVPVTTSTRGATRTHGGSVVVGINRTADRAFRDLLRGEGGPSLREVVADVYEAEVRLATQSTLVSHSVTGETDPDVPAEWSLASTNTTTTTRYRRVNATPVTVADGHPLATFAWRVTTTNRTVRRWRGEGGARTVTTVRNETRRVVVSVVGTHARTDLAPRQTIHAPHAPGGPLDGPNFAAVREEAMEELVHARGGPRALLGRARNGTLDTAPVTVAVTPPDGLRDWLYRDVAALRDRVRNLTVSISGRDLLAVNPAGALADRIADRRSAFRDVPDTYGSAAAKARVAVRTAYLRALSRRLEERRRQRGSTMDAVEGVLADAGVRDALAKIHDEGLTGRSRPGSRQTVVTSVRGTPPYLTVSPVEPDRYRALDRTTYPLVTRNRNLFTVPYGEAASRVAEAVTGRGRTRRVRLWTAAATLRAANRTAATSNRSRTAAYDRLRRQVQTATRQVHTKLVTVLASDRGGLSRSRARAAVDAAFQRWDTIHARALAAANGSLATAVAREANRRDDRGDAVRRDQRAMALRLALDEAVAAATVARGPVAAVDGGTRSRAHQVVGTVTADALRDADRAFRRRVGSAVAAVPAGLPVAPVPGLWYATVNVWRVTVRGQYARFAVTAPSGSPTPDPAVRYVREDRRVALDVDGDGDTELLGHDRPIRFEVSTVVVVVVPPGGSGVGDVDGDTDERSPGWPRPGPGDRRGKPRRAGAAGRERQRL